VGIAFQRDGTLSIDSVKLGAAANNGNALQQLFTTNTNNPLTNGFAVKFAAFSRGAMSSFGMLSNEASALQKQLDSNGKDQDKVNQHVATVQAQLQKQYSALDAQMGSLTALSAYVTQQVTLWNKPTA
jgi:flagellar hook-associated protein 2